jgi:hypothetical protein
MMVVQNGAWQCFAPRVLRDLKNEFQQDMSMLTDGWSHYACFLTFSLTWLAWPNSASKLCATVEESCLAARV